MARLAVTLGIDALSPQLSGIGRYTWELAAGLRGRREIDRLTYYARGRVIRTPRLLLESDEPPPIRRRFGRLQAKVEKHRLRSDLFHGPNFFLPPFVERGVITVHDLSVLRFPETHPAARLREYAMHFERSLAYAAHIITVSETIRQEVIDLLEVPADRVTTVYNGISKSFQPQDEHRLRTILTLWGLKPGEYGLSVATFEPRKKLIELIDAWGALPKDLRSRFPLVLAGAPGWQNSPINDAIERGVSEGWIRNLGYVAERFLAPLYAGSKLFVYPSTYEGFGLPPVEAMACGVPTLVADRSCLPEVTGGAAMLVDPDDHDAFVDSLQRALTDETWRAQAIARGLDRAARFTWRRTVDETIAVYRNCAPDVAFPDLPDAAREH